MKFLCLTLTVLLVATLAQGSALRQKRDLKEEVQKKYEELRAKVEAFVADLKDRGVKTVFTDILVKGLDKAAEVSKQVQEKASGSDSKLAEHFLKSLEVLDGVLSKVKTYLTGASLRSDDETVEPIDEESQKKWDDLKQKIKDLVAKLKAKGGSLLETAEVKFLYFQEKATQVAYELAVKYGGKDSWLYKQFKNLEAHLKDAAAAADKKYHEWSEKNEA